MPWHTGQVWVFGGAPKVVGQPQNILVRVVSCAWTSRPMTTSYFVIGSPRAAGPPPRHALRPPPPSLTRPRAPPPAAPPGASGPPSPHFPPPPGAAASGARAS